MNWKQAFSEYATSTAFHISISKAQLKALKSIRNFESKVSQGEKYNFEQYPNHGSSYTLMVLENKGMIEKAEKDYSLTPVGVMVMSLVDIAKLEERK